MWEKGKHVGMVMNPLLHISLTVRIPMDSDYGVDDHTNIFDPVPKALGQLVKQVL